MRDEEIKNQQQTAWNKFSDRWKKWDRLNNLFTGKVTQSILEFLPAKENAKILDIASGTGEPGLRLASKFSNGKVFLTDISGDMLSVAKELADKRGITNIETVTTPSDNLPFRENSFDALSCRFGFMFFPDIPASLNECYRVIKPEGLIIVAVWAASNRNPFASILFDVANKHLNIIEDDNDTPGFFKSSQTGYLANLFSSVGFTDIIEKEQPLVFEADSVETYWIAMNQLAAPVLQKMSNADDQVKKEIKEEVFERVSKFIIDDRLVIPSCALIVSGKK